jgi:hypothetical protein
VNLTCAFTRLCLLSVSDWATALRLRRVPALSRYRLTVPRLNPFAACFGAPFHWPRPGLRVRLAHCGQIAGCGRPLGQLSMGGIYRPTQGVDVYRPCGRQFLRGCPHCPWRVRQRVVAVNRPFPPRPPTANAPAASAESARGICAESWAADVGGPAATQGHACILGEAAGVSQGGRPSVLPVPDHPAVIERRRSVGILEPSDAPGQHDFLGKRRAAGD